MQESKKLTLIISVIVLVFAFIIIALIYQFSTISALQQDLKNKNAQLENYQQLIQETNNQIELVQTPEYIEKWAKTHLDWVGEGETKFII